MCFASLALYPLPNERKPVTVYFCLLPFLFSPQPRRYLIRSYYVYSHHMFFVYRKLSLFMYVRMCVWGGVFVAHTCSLAIPCYYGYIAGTEVRRVTDVRENGRGTTQLETTPRPCLPFEKWPERLERRSPSSSSSSSSTHIHTRTEGRSEHLWGRRSSFSCLSSTFHFYSSDLWVFSRSLSLCGDTCGASLQDRRPSPVAPSSFPPHLGRELLPLPFTPLLSALATILSLAADVRLLLFFCYSLPLLHVCGCGWALPSLPPSPVYDVSS